eukprot:CAMPEP_0206493732 /NCGR_PEP_ID=MMETSP0324_2-20121206/47203_1 /ASSEMBLY_ACC=CAM_ASM_000836 /TAXON_ID=2866 /ORGANISM="Crypthecodinium cohnii, Strain Seligo" /LENGTH=32 /DNA_ID= /DNA_START= /DNA_END= /DNA_ORIENTATION=
MSKTVATCRMSLDHRAATDDGSHAACGTEAER